MNKTRIIYLAILLSMASLTGCKTMKDSKLALFYHNLTARFNGYFNAKEKMKESEAVLTEMHKNNFNKVIDIFPTGGEEGAKSVVGDMDIIIQKCSRVIKKHDISKWVDDCYFLVGKANFYKRDFFITQETFQYVNLRFPETLRGQEARLWIVRSWLEMDKPQEAQANLSVINNDKGFPEELKTQLRLVEADYYIKTANYPAAITKLEAAVPEVKKKNDRVRYMFILAQLYQRTAQDQKAAAMYRKVIKKNPVYEFSFQSKLKLAEVSTDKDEVKRYLENLTKDDKNISYFDQIYYVLAKIELKENNTEKAIGYLNQSIRKSTENTDQKAISYATLADLYFEQQNYKYAQAYYDSAGNLIDEDFPDHENFKARQLVLNDLISNLITVQEQDSLMKLADMSPEQLENLIDQVIQKEKEEAERQKEAAQNVNNNFQNPNLGLDPMNSGFGQLQGQTTTQTSKNYFSNPTAVALGYSQFISLWGNRPLQDNWRRHEQAVGDVEVATGLGDNITGDPTIDSAALAANPGLRDIPEDRRKYYAGIPYAMTQRKLADEKVQDALFSVGNIYYQNLNDNKNAIASYETLLSRYPDTKYLLQTHYSLFRIYEALNSPDKADQHKNFILKNYPGTDYAMLIENPDQMRERFAGRNRNEALENLYEQAYNSFMASNCTDVRNINTRARDMENNYLEAKFAYLSLLCMGKGNPPGFKDSLQRFISTYPGDEVTKQAVELLKYLNSSQASTTTPYREMLGEVKAADTVARRSSGDRKVTAPADMQIPNILGSQPITLDAPMNSDSVTINAEPVSAYQIDFKQPHYFILIYPLATSSNTVKVAFSNYNKANFADRSLEMSTYVLNNQSQVLMVRNFKDYTDALNYYNALLRQPGFYENISVDPAGSFIISNNNYKVLMKEKKTDQYSKFFKDNYL